MLKNYLRKVGVFLMVLGFSFQQMNPVSAYEYHLSESKDACGVFLDNEDSVKEHIVSDEEFQQDIIKIQRDNANSLNTNRSRQSESSEVSSYIMSGLPSKVDLSQSVYFPPITSQVGNSCVAYSIVYNQFTYEANKLNNIKSSGSENIYSPRYVYNYLNCGGDDGIWKEAAYNFLIERGAIKCAEFPISYYNPDYTSWSTDAEAMRNALNTRLSSWKTKEIDTNSIPILNANDNRLIQIKTLLNLGKILRVSMGWNLSAKFNSNSEYIIYRDADKSTGHSVVVVGYDDNIWLDVNGNGKKETAETGAFKIANSHGTTFFGKDGYAWVLYDALNMDSQIPGNWENGIDTNRISAFAYNSRNIARFDYAFVENKDVDIIAKIDFKVASRTDYNLQLSYDHSGTIEKTKEMLNPEAYVGLFEERRKNVIPYEGTVLYDIGSLLPDEVNLYGTNVWNIEFSMRDIVNTFSNVNYSLIDDKGGKIAVSSEKNTGFLTNATKRISLKTKLFRGDVDYDSYITMDDAQFVLKMSLTVLDGSTLQNKLADYNQDGQVDMTDVNLILKVAVGSN